VAVYRSSSDGKAISYVLPVFSTTSYFYIIEQLVVSNSKVEVNGAGLYYITTPHSLKPLTLGQRSARISKIGLNERLTCRAVRPGVFSRYRKVELHCAQVRQFADGSSLVAVFR